MTRALQTVAASVFMAVTLLAAAPARAGEEIPGYPPLDEYDPREVAMLPKFCPYTTLFNEKITSANNMEEKERYRAVFGDTWRHLHHFCWGLMKTNRAVLLARTEQARRFYLSDAIGEFDYVLQRAPEDFILLPEILARKGQNLIRLGKAPQAIMVLERAAQLKPDYWPPYAYLSDYYLEIGDTKKAREYLERGLAVADMPPLKQRLEDLDRKKPGKPSPQAKASN
jgi:tetratricopeptide (TPR) repeat protein